MHTSLNCSYTTWKNQAYGSLNKQLVRNRTRVTNYKLLKVQSSLGEEFQATIADVKSSTRSEELWSSFGIVPINAYILHVMTCYNEDG